MGGEPVGEQKKKKKNGVTIKWAGKERRAQTAKEKSNLPWAAAGAAAAAEAGGAGVRV
jgi:hypothetical protein